MEQLLQEVDGRHPEWKDIADRSPIYKTFWTQWNSLVLRDGMLKHHW
jgi:hypothetical protein